MKNGVVGKARNTDEREKCNCNFKDNVKRNTKKYGM
jgi:hypothetical protein